MNLAALLPKLGAWPTFVEAVGKLDDVFKAVQPMGARIGTVRGREAAADKQAISQARQALAGALASLHRDARTAGVQLDLNGFRSELSKIAKPLLQDEGAHAETLAALDRAGARGRPTVSKTQKQIRDESVPEARRHQDRMGQIAPKMSKAEVPDDLRVKDVYGELQPDPELGGETVKGSTYLGESAPNIPAGDAAPIPDDLRGQVSGRSGGVDLDALIQSLQSRGKVLGAERFRGGDVPAPRAMGEAPPRTPRGEMQVLDPDLGDILVRPDMPSQDMIPGIKPGRRTYNLSGGSPSQVGGTVADDMPDRGTAPGQQTLDELLAQLMPR